MGRDIRFPDFARSKLPKSKRAHVGTLFTALFVVVVAAILIPAHGDTPRTGAIVIPPPPAITENGQVVQPGALSGAGFGLPVYRQPSRQGRRFPEGQPVRGGQVSADRQPSPPSPGPVTPGFSVALNATGSQLTSWNQTSTFCAGPVLGGPGMAAVHPSPAATRCWRRRAGPRQLRRARQPRRLLVRRDRGVHLLSAASRQAEHHR